MKKFFVVVILFMILISGVSLKSNFSLLNYFSGEYTVYTSTKGKESVNLGFCYMSTNVLTENVIGESVKIENFEPISGLKTLKAKIVKTEYLENGTTVIYAYTNLINDSVKIENKKVNIQVAHKDEYSIIGWPLILGSF